MKEYYSFLSMPCRVSFKSLPRLAAIWATSKLVDQRNFITQFRFSIAGRPLLRPFIQLGPVSTKANLVLPRTCLGVIAAGVSWCIICITQNILAEGREAMVYVQGMLSLPRIISVLQNRISKHFLFRMLLSDLSKEPIDLPHSGDYGAHEGNKCLSRYSKDSVGLTVGAYWQHIRRSRQ